MANETQPAGGSTPSQGSSPLPPTGGAGGQQRGDPAERLAPLLGNSPGQPGAAPDKAGEPGPSQARPADQPAGGTDAALRGLQGMIEATLKPLADRLAQMEKSDADLQSQRRAADQQVQAQRRAADAKDAFIKAQPNLPAALLRRLLPDTDDATALQSAAKEVSDTLKQWLDGQVAAGTLRHVDIGGSRPGGVSAVHVASPDRRSPTERLAASLDPPRT
jgi:hypothetical protein